MKLCLFIVFHLYLEIVAQVEIIECGDMYSLIEWNLVERL